MANTPNLGLHQWGADDAFLREDFNGDFAKLDTAVGAAARCTVGSYNGDGGANRAFDLGERPKLVILMGTDRSANQSFYCTFFLTEKIISVLEGGGTYLYAPPAGYAELTEKGFRLSGVRLNAVGYENHYVAFF